ncbi:MAG: glycerol kinase GlpK [Rectinemataceae bacterium]
MRGECVVSVDQSSAGTKAFVYGRGGAILGSAEIAHDQYYPRPGWVEQDPVVVLANVRESVARAIRASGVDPRRVAGMGITNQRETIVAWDSASGAPLYNAIGWQDERGGPYCDRIVRSGGDASLRRKTGLVPDTNFSAGKLAWLVENVEAARSALWAGRLMCGTIDAWLVWNLTGRSLFATDFSNASRTLLFDIGELAWDGELMGHFGLEGALMPRALPSDGDFGEAVFDGFNLPICAVLGDSHAALYGQGGFERGSAKATYGTGSSVMLNVGEEALSPPAGIVTSVGWASHGRVNYVYEGNIRSSGDTLRWVGEDLGLFGSFEEAEALASSLRDAGGVYLVPAFSGMGAPHWVQGARASITGISRGTGRAHIVRAALESIAYQVRDVLAAMETGGVAMNELQVDGGASSNRFLMQFQSDILRARLRVASVEDVSARGAAFMAGLRCGLWRDEAELSSLARPAAEYFPSMDMEQREASVAGWTAALGRTFHGL